MLAFQDTWIWLAAMYLFLGGLSAGTFLAAGTLSIFRYRRFRKVWRTAFLVAPALLAAGLVFLVFELVKPGKVLVFWQSFSNTSSWMTWGAWMALVCVLLFLLCGILELPGPSGWLSDALGDFPFARERIKTALVALSMAGATFITIYTGMLLYWATGVPFWHSAWLPILFCVSAISAGVSLTIVISGACGLLRQISRRTQRTISAVGFALTTVETIVLTVYVAAVQQGGAFPFAAQAEAALASAQLLTNGTFAPVFWIVVMGMGLTVPAVAYFIGIIRRRGIPAAILISCALLSIVGDAALCGGGRYDRIIDGLRRLMPDKSEFPQEFHGGFGLMTHSGIPKPQYYAMRMMHDLEDQRLDLGTGATDGEIGAAAFIGKNKMQVLLFRQNMKNRNLPKEKVAIRVEMDAAPKVVTLERIDEEHGNPLALWEAWGSPEELTAAQREEMLRKTVVEKETAAYRYENGCVLLEAELDVNDVYLFTIQTQ